VRKQGFETDDQTPDAFQVDANAVFAAFLGKEECKGEDN
jgi:hypothetical protein